MTTDIMLFSKSGKSRDIINNSVGIIWCRSNQKDGVFVDKLFDCFNIDSKVSTKRSFNIFNAKIIRCFLERSVTRGGKNPDYIIYVNKNYEGIIITNRLRTFLVG